MLICLGKALSLALSLFPYNSVSSLTRPPFLSLSRSLLLFHFFSPFFPLSRQPEMSLWLLAAFEWRCAEETFQPALVLNKEARPRALPLCPGLSVPLPFRTLATTACKELKEARNRRRIKPGPYTSPILEYAASQKHGTGRWLITDSLLDYATRGRYRTRTEREENHWRSLIIFCSRTDKIV